MGSFMLMAPRSVLRRCSAALPLSSVRALANMVAYDRSSISSRLSSSPRSCSSRAPSATSSGGTSTPSCPKRCACLSALHHVVRCASRAAGA